MGSKARKLSQVSGEANLRISEPSIRRFAASMGWKCSTRPLEPSPRRLHSSWGWGCEAVRKFNSKRTLEKLNDNPPQFLCDPPKRWFGIDGSASTEMTCNWQCRSRLCCNRSEAVSIAAEWCRPFDKRDSLLLAEKARRHPCAGGRK